MHSACMSGSAQGAVQSRSLPFKAWCTRPPPPRAAQAPTSGKRLVPRSFTWSMKTGQMKKRR